MIIRRMDAPDLSHDEWKDPASIWNSHPSNHRLAPGGGMTQHYEWVRDRIPRGAKVLDVGCNCGQLAVNLTNDLGCEVHGVDVVPDFVRHCNQEKGKYIKAWCADFSRLTPDQMRALHSLGPFDVVTTLEVIEHAIDIRGYLTNVKIALRDGGRLIVTTPHPDSVEYGYEFMRDTVNHVRMWSKLRLEMVFGPISEYEEIYYDGKLSNIGAMWTC